MNRFFHTLCFVCSFSLLTFAQPYIGQKFIGGSFLLNKGTTTTAGNPQIQDDLYFGFGPNGGLMLNARTALMAGVFFNRSERTLSTTNGQTQKQIREGYGTNLTVRRFFPLVEKIGLFLQGGISYSWMKGRSKDSNGSSEMTRDEFKENAFSAGIVPGIYFFVTDQIALEASFGSINYTNSNRKFFNSNTVSQNSTRSQFSLSGNTQLSFGVRYYWGPKILFKPIKG